MLLLIVCHLHHVFDLVFPFVQLWHNDLFDLIVLNAVLNAQIKIRILQIVIAFFGFPSDQNRLEVFQRKFLYNGLIIQEQLLRQVLDCPITTQIQIPDFGAGFKPIRQRHIQVEQNQVKKLIRSASVFLLIYYGLLHKLKHLKSILCSHHRKFSSFKKSYHYLKLLLALVGKKNTQALLILES